MPDIRLTVDSSESRIEPLRCSFAEASSSAVAPSLLDLPHLLERDVQHALQVLRRAGGVDGLVAAVEVAVVVRHDGVDEAFLLADALEEARRHPAAEDGVEERRGIALVALLRKAARAEAEVNLLELAFLAQDHVLRGRRRVPVASRAAPRVAAERLSPGTGRSAPGRTLPDAQKIMFAGWKVSRVVREDLLPPQPVDRLLGAENRPAERMVGPERGRRRSRARDRRACPRPS